MERARLFLACLALLAVACAPAPRACIELPAAAEVERDLEAALPTLDFAPLRPCAFGSGYRLETVFLDELPGRPPEARITFEVSRHGARAYLLSHTRAEVPFRAIPQGSHRLSVEVGAVVASGFAGPAGTGEVIAYLRWRHRGVTSELAATLAPSFTEADLLRTAEALLAAGPARAASRSPTNAAMGAPEGGAALTLLGEEVGLPSLLLADHRGPNASRALP